MSTRAKLMVALVVVVGVIGMLVRTAVTHASTYYVTVNEFFQESPATQHDPTTISGEIIGSSINWNPTSGLLKFNVQDKTGGKALTVVYHGAKPDDFTDNWPVIVTGMLQSDGSFHASKLLIKCPSKYQAQNQAANAAS
ncbi:cytochrome c maturation protein CcmE [Alicyclobacillus curvatus]|nr:cytochrome c maturation protein CcmE [Alicyclobacillus curvatus]